MSDLILLTPDSSGTSYHTTEHYLRKVLIGDVASVRLRLIAAFELLGYDILDDEDTVIRGRRGARGWATSHASADVLDYPMTLLVKLKAQGEHASRATFDYVVKHPMLSVGEKDILTREAEAISALATVRAVDKICSACGTESTDDSRFCRRCGNKMTFESTDLEVLRISAETRASHTSIVSTFVLGAISAGVSGGTLAIILLSATLTTKGLAVLVFISFILNLIAILCAAFGWNRINRALRRAIPDSTPGVEMPVEIPRTDTPAQLQPMSITERTTSLLSKEKAPAQTGEFPIESTNVLNSNSL